jgi:outer membrane protein TolC
MTRASIAAAALLCCVAASETARAQDETPNRPPMSLKTAIHLALKTSPEGHQADARVMRTEAEHDLAIAGYLPRVEVGGRAGASTVQDTLLFRRDHFTMTTRFSEGRGDVSWTLYDFGRTSNIVKATNASGAAAASGREAARASIRLRTAELYVTVLFDDQILQAKKVALRHRARFLAVAHGLVTQGVRPALDEARAKVAVEASRTDVAIAEARLASDRARLASQLGQDPESLPPLANVYLPGAKDEPETATKAADARPEVVEATHEVRAAERRVDATWAAHLPRIGIDVGGSYRFTHRDFDDATVPRRELMGIATVSVPLFDAALNAHVDIVRADLAAARAREERVRRAARLDARDATLALRAARAVQVRAKDLLNAADTVFQVVEARYQSGLATPIELIDAESSEVEARETLAGAELRLQLATLALLVATHHTQSLEGS